MWALLLPIQFILALTLASDNLEAPERTFDLSKFPNFQEVYIAISWVGGRLPWIPAALSTLKPTTSPHLSTITLRFTRVRSVNRPARAVIKDMRDDIQWVTDESIRINREFEGAVNFTVHRDSGFAEFDKFQVSFRFLVDHVSWLCRLTLVRSPQELQYYGR